MLDRIDEANRLYVMKHVGGYGCLGFEVAERWTLAYAAFAKRGDLLENRPAVGTREAFALYETALSAARRHHELTGDICTAFLTPQLIGLEGRRVEVTYPDGTKARFKVGKSTGWAPVHLELPNARSTGGGAVHFPKGSVVQVIR